MDVMYKFIDVFTVIAVLWVFVVFWATFAQFRKLNPLQQNLVSIDVSKEVFILVLSVAWWVSKLF